MDIGICVPSHVGDIDYVVRAEELGYSHAWLADSQMIWSDCYAALAIAAYRTNKINLGTGVAITGTRPPSVNAAGIATIPAPGTSIDVVPFQHGARVEDDLMCRDFTILSMAWAPSSERSARRSAES